MKIQFLVEVEVFESNTDTRLLNIQRKLLPSIPALSNELNKALYKGLREKAQLKGGGFKTSVLVVQSLI